jgi:peptidoglycan/xylan/chitin deacetylase (PgdA/CDA1 family)
MPETRLSIKVDVDTDRGTRVGVPRLLDLFDEFGIRATFLFSLGPDNTGRAIRRIFRPGFFQKMARTSAVSIYGLRTLLNGVLPDHVGRRTDVMPWRDRGHEVGIHCYDHIRWQDGLARMSRAEVYAEFDKARHEFERIYGEPAQTAGAAGWQANALSLAAYDDAGLRTPAIRADTPFSARERNRVQDLQVDDAADARWLSDARNIPERLVDITCHISSGSAQYTDHTERRHD